MDQSKISIIMPVYQVEDYLCASIDCILQQTYANWELILVDDGSRDKSGMICDEYAHRDHRVHVIHQKNQGVSAARNVGIQQAQGDFLGFIDSDDLIKSDYLEVLYRNAVEQHADIVCCNALEWNGKTYQDYHCTEGKRKIADLQTLFEDTVLCRELYGRVVWAKLIRTALAKSISFSTLRYTEDTLYMLQLFAEKPVVYLDDYAGYIYVRHAGSAMDVNQVKKMVRHMDNMVTAAYCFHTAHDLHMEEHVCTLAANYYADVIHNAAATTTFSNQTYWGANRKLIREHAKELLTGKNGVSFKKYLRLWLYEYIPVCYLALLRIILKREGNAV